MKQWMNNQHLKSLHYLLRECCNQTSQKMITIIDLFLIDEALAKRKTMFPYEKASTIQYFYRKYVTHSWVFSQTLAHGKSKNKIRERKVEGKKRRVNIWKDIQWCHNGKLESEIVILVDYMQKVRANEGLYIIPAVVKYSIWAESL